MNQIAEWAITLQAMAQNGLAYVKDIYDKERYEQLRHIAAEMLAFQQHAPVETIEPWFCAGNGYQTPKLDCRAAVIQNGNILLVQERNGSWAMPGGWVDVTDSPARATVREVKEEAGLDVAVQRLVAVQEHSRHHGQHWPFGICTVISLCTLQGGSFVPNIETITSGFFSPDDLPSPLAAEKTTAEQIALCFAAAADPHWQPPVE